MTPIQKALSALLFKHPFFATLLMSTPIHPADDIPTLATDGLSIWYNPAFVESLSPRVLQFALAHEAGHILLEHSIRQEERRHDKFNAACDYVLNALLKKSGFELWDRCLYSKEYADMTAEQVYRLLPDDPPQDGLGKDLRPKVRDGAEKAQVRQQVQQRVAQAASVARATGNLSADMDRLVQAVVNPQPPWQEILQDYCTQVAHDNEDWSRRDYRFRGVYLPQNYSEQMGEMVFIGDTSGSIDREMLNAMAGVITTIADQLQPSLVRVVWAGKKVQFEEMFETGTDIQLHPKGGGGTDMRVPLGHVAQYEPAVVVMLTDGHTPWPVDEPEYPLVVCCTTDVPVPVGMVVRL